MKDRPFVTLARELNYQMSQPKHEAVPSEAPLGEKKFTVIVYDDEGRVQLFRQIRGYSAAGVLTQYTEQVSSGNRDYGLDTTDHSQQPDFTPAAPPKCGIRCWPYTTHNACVREMNHSPRHKDARGRKFD